MALCRRCASLPKNRRAVFFERYCSDATPICRSLLALHDAGRLELLPGRVTVKQKIEGRTIIEVEHAGQVSQHTYEMFVDCTGQGAVELDQFPFPNMIECGVAVEASAPLRDQKSIDKF